MPYEPLHHKYRPQTFAELVGQEAIATTLSNALLQKRIAPAYLFSGPRGTGKTSSARILAKSLNCLNSANPTPNPCGECEVCRAIANGSALDVIEIDAASNTGVDNIRELIERSQFAPVQCRYKVYVIDECHMLSVAAFNALLKTLEEPPNHVVFVLATTDPQRVLPTIISRCQRFDYRRIPLDAMVGHLRKIAQIENIDIPLESVTLVAQIANGGLRDAESLLDQLSLMAGEIVPDKVWDLVGAVPERDLLALIQVIGTNNPESVIQQCRNLLNRGREPLVVLQNLASFYLNLLIAKTAPQRGDLIAITQPTWQALCEEANNWQPEVILRGQQHLKDSEYQLKNTTQPRLWLEITLLGLLPSALTNIQGITTTTVNIPAPAVTPQKIQPVPQPIPAPPSPATHPFGETTANSPVPAPVPLAQPMAAIAPPPPQPIPAPVPEPIPDPVVSAPPANIAATNGNGIPAPVVVQSPAVQPITPPEVVLPPQPEPTPSPAPIPAPENVTSSPTISALEREQLWETVIAQLDPPSTQQLFRQQGCLVSFVGNMAVVGVKSQPLLKMAKSREDNLAIAFQKASQRKVKVSFQVGHEPTTNFEGMATTTVANPAPVATSPEMYNSPPAIAPPSQQPNPFNDPPAPTVVHTPIPAPVVPAPQPPAPMPVPTPIYTQPVPAPLPPTEAPLETLPTDISEGLLPEESNGDRRHQMITQEFADFFAGKVIELPHLAPDEPTNGENLSPAILEPLPVPVSEPAVKVQGRSPVTTSPDDDIPF
ncbi:MAG: DNA polymerase III subunit gamma/tau [Limnothrix sp. RL_2_0]|nr:DNA polymerase III subunit gamma/tau [Limnothrix sp. RL_2_0]